MQSKPKRKPHTYCTSWFQHLSFPHGSCGGLPTLSLGTRKYSQRGAEQHSHIAALWCKLHPPVEYLLSICPSVSLGLLNVLWYHVG